MELDIGETSPLTYIGLKSLTIDWTDENHTDCPASFIR